MNHFAKVFRPVIAVLFAALCVLFLLGITLSQKWFVYVGATVLITAMVGVAICGGVIGKRLRGFSADLSALLTDTQSNLLTNFPMPIIMVLDNGDILWYNKACRSNVLKSDDMHDKNIAELFSGIIQGKGGPEQTVMQLTYKKNKYTAYVARMAKGDTSVRLFFLADDTELKRYRDRYLKTRITIMLVMIDNYEEILQSARESERSQLLPDIEYEIESYLKGYGALICRMERDKYLVIVEETAMQEIASSRFALLDNVRKIEISPRVPATLSIGVGQHAATLAEAEDMARQALDMALGRGGDQAAVKTQNGYEFYGGVSKGIEKRTKVKTRIVATALAELILSSSNVIVMGHRFSDLDCVGSAVGLCKAAQILGKRANIAIYRDRTLAKVLIDKLLSEGYDDIFRVPEELFEIIERDTLLIITDVHAKHFIESLDLYQRCRSVVVIDHHRKMVDYIDNAVIFYHEPYASSASEMVAELVQYFGLQRNLGSPEAEALLAGIMLDTKNFVMKAGVRTFEAAAYLKRLGADTVEVRKLFSSPMEDYQKKAKLVSSATEYRNCAIAMSTGVVEDIKLIAPQAADELLSITGVDASFVLFENSGQVEISARSMGTVNVQLIMEKLGGGGHLNMAAAQLRDADIEDAHQMLLAAIDDYFNTLAKN